jgi:hypothetical protein
MPATRESGGHASGEHSGGVIRRGSILAPQDRRACGHSTCEMSGEPGWSSGRKGSRPVISRHGQRGYAHGGKIRFPADGKSKADKLKRFWLTPGGNQIHATRLRRTKNRAPPGLRTGLGGPVDTPDSTSASRLLAQQPSHLAAERRNTFRASVL